MAITYKEWIELLFEYTDKNKCIPVFRTEYNDFKIGRWYYDKRTNIDKTSQIYKDLSTNKCIKQDLDDYISKKPLVANK